MNANPASNAACAMDERAAVSRGPCIVSARLPWTSGIACSAWWSVIHMV